MQDSSRNLIFVSAALLVISLSLSGFTPSHAGGKIRSPKSKTLPFKDVKPEPELEPKFKPNDLTYEPVGNIKFSYTLSSQDYVMIAKDLHALKTMRFASDPDLLRLLKIKDSSTPNLVKWLEERVKVIDRDPLKNTDPMYDTLVAYNYGSAVYKFTKNNNHQAVTLNIPGVGPLLVTSPRVGLIRLGPAYHSSDYSEAFLSSARVRIETLFHEARHGDGNGNAYSKSLTFPHAQCPAGHDLAGKTVCDQTLNGAYAIGAAVLKSLSDGCEKCSAFGKMVMKLTLADELSRVIQSDSAKEEDDTPETLPRELLPDTDS